MRAVTLDLDGLDAEAVEAACFEAGAYAVVLTDQRDDAILEPKPGEIRLWPATRLQAIFPDDFASVEKLDVLAERLGCERSSLSVEDVEERVWEREWLKDFKPMRFGDRLWICPSHAEVNEPEAIVVRLDPGLAFGTGTHPTTRLCLEYLDTRAARRAREADRIVDFGCGSGVLAIAALRLQPAARAFVHDIDPQALIATVDNARANDVDQRIESFVEAVDLSTRLRQQGGAELVLANILSGPLCELAPQLTALLAPGGEIVLAGLLDEQAEDVITAYAPAISLTRWRNLEGWSCLSGRLA
ncbi:MAG: 50S ribosomal protein L11 methyltransferase [Gammaproteobacteria bacterium]|nr:50S ribosomal protein L11 methyltransferase [Gammaproteobacteria bacterium]